MRKAESFNLAFLDIMACGLGAVVLVLVLLKGPTEASQASVEDLESLQQKIQSLQSENKNINEKISDASNAHSSAIKESQDQLAELEKVKQSISSKQSEIKVLEQKLASVKKLPKVSKAPTPKEAPTPERHLVGLDVTGSKIVILLDQSASMVDESLLQIAIGKAKGVSGRKNSLKWVRAKKITNWIMDQVPAGSKFKVLTFNDQPKWMTSNWVYKSDIAKISSLRQLIESTDPSKGTNLEKAVLKAQSESPDAIYLVTDGLPTIGDKSDSVIPSGGCGGPLSGKTVSGQCRVTLMNDLISQTQGFRGRVSVVLLPLEGDPQAAPMFSKWALASGGKMLSPPRGWP